jgi:hypothetical protein
MLGQSWSEQAPGKLQRELPLAKLLKDFYFKPLALPS